MNNALEILNDWLYKQGYPDKQVEWFIVPLNKGRLPKDAWNKLPTCNLPLKDEDVASLPKGKKLGFKLVGGDTIKHVTLFDNEYSPPETGTALIPPELLKFEKELDERRRKLDLEKQQLGEWEQGLRDLDIALRKTFVLQTQTGSSLETRLKSGTEHLKEWEQHLVSMNDREAVHFQEISELEDKKNKLAEKNAIAAQIGQVFDKISATVILSRVKKYEDLPAGMIADFQQYLIDRADRRFFENHPGSVALLGDSFLRMTRENQEEFAADTIKWAFYNCPSMIQEVAKECMDEQKQSNEVSKNEI